MAATRPPLGTSGMLPSAFYSGLPGAMRLDWRATILILLVILLIYQVIVPLLIIVWTSLKTVRPGDEDYFTFTFTIANYISAFSTEDFWSATWSTLYFAAASTVIAFIAGVFLAWAVNRTNMPFAQLIGMCTLARIIIPGILVAVSWLLVASPRIGIANHFVFNVFGIRDAFDIYTFWGMVWVNALEMIPLAYLLLTAAFQSMDPRLEEASVMTGAGTLRTLMRVTLPLNFPAVAAAALLLFITTVDEFTIPLLLGGRAKVFVYATEVYYNTSRSPTDWGMASTYAMSLLVLSFVLLVVYFRLIRFGERYQTVTGKDFRPRRVDLRGWKYLVCGLSLLIAFLVSGIPFLVMLYASFLEFWEPPSLEALSEMSLQNYWNLLGGEAYAAQPMLNSTLLGLGTATAVMIVVSAISFFVYKTEIPGRKALDFIAFSTIAFPGVVIGAAFLWLYLLIPVPIIGTLFIIGLAYLTKYMAIALRFVSTSMIQIHPELEEAALVAGVPWWKNFYRIYLPLLRPGLMAGWFWIMVHAYRELTIALMLARSENRTAAVVIFDLWDTGSFMELSAFGVLMFILLLVLVSVTQVVSKRYGIQD